MLSKIMVAVKSARKSLYVRWTTLVVLASAVSYILAGFTELASPTIAALTAALMVQGTFHESVRESLLQIVGVMMGALLGVLLVIFFGQLSVFALIIATVAGFAFAGMVKMGVHSAISMVIPIIVIVGGQFLSVYSLEQRVLGVTIGIVVALAASYATRAGKPTERIVMDLKDINMEVSAVLTDVANSLTEGKVSQSSVDRWEKVNMRCLIEVFWLRQDAEEAIVGSKYSPFVKKTEATKVLKESEKVLTTVMSSIGTVESFKEVHKKELALSKKKKTEIIKGHSKPKSVNSEKASEKKTKTKTFKVVKKEKVRPNGGAVEVVSAEVTEVTTQGDGEVRDGDTVFTDKPISKEIPAYMKKTADIISHKTPQLNDKGELVKSFQQEDEIVKAVIETQSAVKDLVKESEETKELILGSSLIANLHKMKNVQPGEEKPSKE